MPILTAQEHARNRVLLDAIDVEAGPGYERLDQSRDDVEWKFLEGEADLALASPLVFAKREGDLALLAGACVAATGATDEIILQFNTGLRRIDTVGFYGEPGLETMLTEIVLKEKYGMHPRFFPMKREPGSALAAVDAMLFIPGDEHEPTGDATALDIIDEWFDMTQMPFVREVLIGWEARMDQTIDDAMRRAGEAVDAQVLESIDEQMRGKGTETGRESIPAHYRYKFTPDAQEGLQSFFHMAFYHGLHRDIPNFTFWEPEEEEE